MEDTFELGPIRPPSEAFSLLLRLTRNCPWNRCNFCSIYKNQKFELRGVEEIKRDIDTVRDIRERIMVQAASAASTDDPSTAGRMMLARRPEQSVYSVALWLYGGGRNVFLQDANTLIMRTHELVEVLEYLKATFPDTDRVTSYARAKTASKKSADEMKALHEAGLTRLHIGLETGSDAVLKLMDKGVTAAEQITGGRRVVEAGIQLSEYYLVGLGGRGLWRENAVETARVLSAINPDYIRLRTLSVYPTMPMNQWIADGSFELEDDEEMIDELRLMIDGLECESRFVSDHINNLLQEVEGKLPDDKSRMLAIIDRFKALPDDERTNYRIGRRARIYDSLDELGDKHKHDVVERIVGELRRGNHDGDPEQIEQLMKGYFISL